MIRFLRFLQLRLLQPLPPGMTADESALFSLLALMSNANAYCGQLVSIATTTANAVVLTAAQAIQRIVRLTAGANAGYTITLPATSAIISAMGPTIPTDGTYGQAFSVLNDGIGQTGTLTVGDSSTTLNGTATVLTNTRRDWWVTVTSPTTITIQNIGSAAI